MRATASEDRRLSGDVLAVGGDEATIRRLGIDALHRGHRVDAARALGVGFGLDAAAADAMLIDVLKTGC